MGKNNIWMPLYTGDYLRSTLGITLEQHGAYLLAIMMYWDKGESLTDDELREVCRYKRKVYDRIKLFFHDDNGRWQHKRLNAELDRAHLIYLKGMEKVKKMNEAKARKQGHDL